MTDKTLSEQIDDIDQLKDTLHKAEKKRTLEEQVAYMKERGIDPAKSYVKWDDDKDEWKQDEWEDDK